VIQFGVNLNNREPLIAPASSMTRAMMRNHLSPSTNRPTPPNSSIATGTARASATYSYPSP